MQHEAICNNLQARFIVHFFLIAVYCSFILLNDRVVYLQLILGTVPDHVNSTSPRIVSEDNIKFLFEVQKKVSVPSPPLVVVLNILMNVLS